jgi:hypothetical protein
MGARCDGTYSGDPQGQEECCQCDGHRHTIGGQPNRLRLTKQTGTMRIIAGTEGVSQAGVPLRRAAPVLHSLTCVAVTPTHSTSS